MTEYRYEPEIFVIEDALKYLIESNHSLHRKFDAMSKTLSDVKDAIADLDTTTSTALADIASDISALQAQISAGSTPPDVQPLLDALAAIKAKVVAADPGPQPVAAAPSA